MVRLDGHPRLRARHIQSLLSQSQSLIIPSTLRFRPARSSISCVVVACKRRHKSENQRTPLSHNNNNKNNRNMIPNSTLFALLLLLSGMLGYSLSFSSPTSRRAFLAAAVTGSASAVLLTTATGPPAATAAAASAPTNGAAVGGKIVYGDESIMTPKAHGTSAVPVQDSLRFGVSNQLADRICNYNRHFAEQAGYFTTSKEFETLVSSASEERPITFYDSVTGRPLFVAPIGRTAEDFLAESRIHGWPSFRDAETVWSNVRVLRNSGETVSVDGTHLGHNLPDRSGNRYCINLVSVAGRPPTTTTAV
jgi:peptide methionine sulfoxide reductase MsrB